MRARYRVFIWLMAACGVASHPALSGPVLANAALVHKFHESLAQLDYNAESRSVEMTFRLFADDLENALSKRSGKTFRLDRTPDAAAQTLAYIKERFELKNGEGEIKPLTWVGMEAKVDTVWVYVEAQMAEGLKGAEVRNRIFFELFDDQVNRVHIRYDGGKTDLVYKRGDHSFKSVPAARK